MRKAKITLMPFALVTAAVLSFLAPTGARAQSTLRWKYQPGETFKYEMNQKGSSKVSAGGQSYETAMSQSIDTTWTVKSVQDDKADLIIKFDRLRSTFDTPTEKIDYDSKDSKPPTGRIAQLIVPIFDAIVGAEFSFKMNAQGEISDVKLPENLVNQLKALSQVVNTGGQFTEEGLKNQFTQATIILPKESMSRGKTWTNRITMPSPEGSTVNLTSTFTYDGPTPRGASPLEKIDVKINLDIKAKEGAQEQVSVKSQDAKGSFFFDNEKGRLVESTITRKVELNATSMGKSYVQTLDSTEMMKLLGSSGG